MELVNTRKVVAVEGYEVTIDIGEFEAGVSMLFSVKDLRKDKRIENQLTAINARYAEDYVYAFHG